MLVNTLKTCAGAGLNAAAAAGFAAGVNYVAPGAALTVGTFAVAGAVAVVAAALFAKACSKFAPQNATAQNVAAKVTFAAGLPIHVIDGVAKTVKVAFELVGKGLNLLAIGAFVGFLALPGHSFRYCGC